jgi:hypothetical protein
MKPSRAWLPYVANGRRNKTEQPWKRAGKGSHLALASVELPDAGIRSTSRGKEEIGLYKSLSARPMETQKYFRLGWVARPRRLNAQNRTQAHPARLMITQTRSLRSVTKRPTLSGPEWLLVTSEGGG